MDHILNLIERAREMKNTQPEQMQAPEPTEKAQIVVHYSGNRDGVVFRFSTVKKGKAQHEKMVKAWERWRVHCTGCSLHHVDGDMFTGTVDLDQVAGCLFVDFGKRNKFIPVQ